MIKLIKPGYEILTDISEGGTKELQLIERAARVCYKSESKISPDGESAKKLVARLIKNEHDAMLEHSFLTVIFTVDRGVSHEIVRHRHFSFAQESTRYCDYGGGLQIIDFTPYLDDKSKYTSMAHIVNAELNYDILRAQGVPPQIARDVLPTSVKTELVVSGNYREWRHFFKLRCDKAAHPQMREVAIPLLKELQGRIPIIFDDLEV